MAEIIRSGYCSSDDGLAMFCEFLNGKFMVQSRWEIFHKSSDVYEALAVFEGLCGEEQPSREHTKRLVIEARRNHRNRFTKNAAWEIELLNALADEQKVSGP